VTAMPTDLSHLSFDDLRTSRSEARHELEVAMLRGRSDRVRSEDGGRVIEQLRELVRELTRELIARYAADLDLVDELLVSS